MVLSPSDIPRESPVLLQQAWYWNADLWNSLFTKLLNSNSGSDTTVLRGLRQSFEDYMSGKPQLIKKLKMLLVRQRGSMCKAA
ncbi:hypothetical protein ACLOJK_029785 [Asimina triloba]